MDSIKEVNNLNKSDFISIFGNVFEKTEWIAESVFKSAPFKNFEELALKFISTFETSKKENLHKILNAHPELVVEQNLTTDSTQEQNTSGLHQCTKDDLKEFKELNLRYREKFGFPFIIAVKGKSRIDILENFRKRINNFEKKEFNEATQQVKEIASLRLNKIIK